jgi:hypothetical protein
MAANTSQGRSLGVFLAGLTAVCVGIGYWSTGIGKVVGLAGAAGLVIALLGFLQIKPGEGKTAQKPGSNGLKAIGGLLACLGWVVILLGLPLVTGTGGRIVLGLGGIAVSLFGIIYVLPTAFNKNAIWKT